ncbi:receptor-like protein 50 [Prunus dulcis]|uniref:receptor-like protein 50 n=1 Tax=Prunus dulcis TaxID=3755 RepID=UPI00148356F3|nr:receptor-like protein 50 [Prunus dulcis]
MDKAMRFVSVFRFLSIATITTISLCNGNLGVPRKQNERQALLMFKQDLKDPSNRLLSWVGEGDFCNWTGVVCDNLTGHVRELHLGNYYSDEYLNYSLYQENFLGGKVTNTLPSMLVELHMSGCELNQIPVGVANMTRLKVVNLRWNIIWAIVNLDLSANQIEGKMPNSLGNLCKLTVLDLSRNYFNGSVSEILGSFVDDWLKNSQKQNCFRLADKLETN